MENIQNLDQLITKESDRVVKLISKIIETRYPDFNDKDEVPFDDLLEWELWPGILKIYSKMHGDIIPFLF